MERRRSALRTAVVWDALQGVLRPQADDLAVPQPIDVIDLGGGTGGFAVRIAELGHRVTVVDPSPDALASLERRASEAGVEVAAVLADADTLLDVVEPGRARLLLCHGVLEVVDDPGLALRRMAGALAQGATLSLLVAQKSGAVLGRALAGHLGDARTLLDDPEGQVARGDSASRRFTQAALRSLLDEAGFDVREVRGVRIFTDHLSSTVVDADPAAADELRALEAAVADDPEYMSMATQLHVLAVAR